MSGVHISSQQIQLGCPFSLRCGLLTEFLKYGGICFISLSKSSGVGFEIPQSLCQLSVCLQVTIATKGELLIVLVAIGTNAVGKLIGSGSGKKILKITAGGACIFLVIISSLLFAVTSKQIGINFDSHRIYLSSILMFLMTIVSSGSCILLSEVQK